MTLIKPWRITIDTNPDQCNFNCIMCDTHSIYNKEFKYTRKSMQKDMLVKIIDEVLSIGVLEIIPTTMGEPLIYENFDVFIDELKNTNTKLNLTTNGTFPNGIENWALKLLPVLSDIKISINAINPTINEKIMIGDDTIKKTEDIKTFIKLRNEINQNVSITLQVTFLKSNLSELENIIKFGIVNGINRIKGHHLWINWNEMNNESLQNSNDKIIEWNNFVESIDKYKSQIKLVNFNKLELYSDSKILPEEYNCPFLGKELWIDYNGDFNICCAPSKERVKLGYWGNIQNRSISDLFNSSEYYDLLKNYKTKSVCKICPLRKN